jgi:hypothetical protein
LAPTAKKSYATSPFGPVNIESVERVRLDRLIREVQLAQEAAGVDVAAEILD